MSVTVSRLIKSAISLGSLEAYKYHGTGIFIDKVFAINDSNDSNEFFKSFKNIYPNEREMNVEHNRKLGTFLDLGITIKDNTFI